MFGRSKRLSCAIALAAVFVGLCGCAPASTGAEQPDDSTQSIDGGGDQGADNGDGTDDGTDEGDVDDGDADPEQDTRRSGPAVDFGGPPFGEQGDPEFESDGVWCVTVGFFWGGEAPPQNVTFTVTGIESDPEGALTGEAAVCGQSGAEQTCIGFVMAPDTPFTTCSLRLRATDAFEGTAQVGFVGTLECTEAQYCDAAVTRVAEPGPPIVVEQG